MNDDDFDDGWGEAESISPRELVGPLGVLRAAVGPAPLPLMSFRLDPNDYDKARTIYGDEIRSIRNTYGETAAAIAQLRDPLSECSRGRRLQDPCFTRGLSRWFTARCQREILARQNEPFKAALSRIESDSSLDSKGGASGSSSSSMDNSSGSGALLDLPVYTRPPFRKTGGGKKGATSASAQAQAVACICPPPPPAGTECGRSHPSCPACLLQSSLTFDSDFESGNLEKATRVENRAALMSSPRATEFLQQYQVPAEVDQEYDLSLQNDVYTSGNIQWYYFSATAPPPSCAGGAGAGAGGSAVRYPLKVRFHIVNMHKSDALYSYGMKPCVFSCNKKQQGWNHGGSDVCYFKNGLTALRSSFSHVFAGGEQEGASSRAGPDGSSTGQSPANQASPGLRKKQLRQYYSLAFTYTFDKPGTVYFSHAFPYTYTDLQAYLASLQSDERVAQILRRKLLCTSLAGNRCDLLTITSRAGAGAAGVGVGVGAGSGSAPPDMASAHVNPAAPRHPAAAAAAAAPPHPATTTSSSASPTPTPTQHGDNKPAIIISARVHPGESNSSFAVHGLVAFLVSDTPEAEALRRQFVFKIVPMLNPDGVVHGNYRCSLAGTDLNRRYSDNYPYMYPTGKFSIRVLALSLES